MNDGRIETSGWEEWNITGTRQAEELQEELLDGWLQMSTVICNERLVSAMTYNESMVCGVLHRNRQKRVTATDLCAKLRILKPQMNAILNGLQNRGMLERCRDGELGGGTFSEAGLRAGRSRSCGEEG